jgi:hypothetical protein
VSQSSGYVAHWNGTAWKESGLLSPAVNTAVWGTGASDVWMGGDYLWHWNGSSYAQGPYANDVFAIHGTAANDVWAATDYAALHWDGLAWTQKGPSYPGYTGLFAIAPSDVWAVTSNNARKDLAHWDGTRWNSSTADVPLSGVWAAASNDVWFVGDGGAIRHWDGTQLTASSSPTTNGLRAVFGRSANDVFAVGYGGTVLHWNGTAWSAIETGCATPLDAVFALGADVWIGGSPGALLHGAP